MLKERLERFEEAEKELRNNLKYAAGEDIENMDDETLRAVRSVFKFMDASAKLITEQTKAIDNMNRKIDEILSKVKGH